MNNDPTLPLHKGFLGLNLTFMNIIDCLLMQLLKVTHLTLAQLWELPHK